MIFVFAFSQQQTNNLSNQTNQKYSNASLANDQRYRHDNNSEPYNYNYPIIRNDIWDFHTKETILRNGPYYPMWQSSPIVPMNSNVPLYNQDNFILFEELDSSTEVISSDENDKKALSYAVVTKIMNTNRSNNIYAEWMHQYPHPITPNYDIEPFSFLYYPIRSMTTTMTTQKTDSSMIEPMNQPEKKLEMVGILSVAFYWIGYLQNIHYFYDAKDTTSDLNRKLGIITVLSNDCNQIETYRLVSTNFYGPVFGCCCFMVSWCHVAIVALEFPVGSLTEFLPTPPPLFISMYIFLIVLPRMVRM
jgi:hypothetical protein